MKEAEKFFPRTVFLILALLAVLTAQSFLLEKGLSLDALVFLSLAIGLVWFGKKRYGCVSPFDRVFREEEATVPLVSRRSLRASLLKGALASALIGFLSFGGNRLSLPGLFFTLLALVLLVLSAAQQPAPRSERPHEEGRLVLRLSRYALLILGISLLGFLLRSHNLQDLPGDMTSAQVEELLEVQTILSGQPLIYFQRSVAREPLFLYLTAMLVGFTPFSVGFGALKWVSVLLGVLTIPLTCLLGREVLGRGAGLLAGLLLALSNWHLISSRNGFQQSLASAVSAAFLFFWWRAVFGNRRNDWLAAGALAGVGLLSSWYLCALPVLLLAVPLLRVSASFGNQTEQELEEAGSSGTHPVRQNAALSLTAAILVASPLIYFLLTHPRILNQALLSGSTPAAGPWKGLLAEFLSRLWNTLWMFNLKSDPNWADSLSGVPALGWIAAALFALGILILSICQTGKTGHKASVSLAFLALILPAVLDSRAPADFPSLARTAGVLPLVYVIAAVPLAQLWRLKDWFGRSGRLLIVFGLAVLLVGVFVESRENYFQRYSTSYGERSWNSREMGRVVQGFVESIGDPEDAFLLTYPHWVDYRAVGIEAGVPEWPNLVTNYEALGSRADYPRLQLFIVHPQDFAGLSRLRSVFPQALVQQHHSLQEGKDFSVVLVPPLSTPQLQPPEETR